MHRRGFTLIELLVVISIISLLASVVLASLNAARDKGRIGAIRYFAAQVDHAAGDSAVGLWDFDDCPTSTTVDRSGFGNTGTLFNSASASSYTPSGTGCSLSLSGSNSYVSIATSTSLDLTAFTISLWWDAQNGSSWAGPFNDRISGQSGFQFVDEVSTANFQPHLTIWNGSAETNQFKANVTPIPYPFGKFIHFAWTWDGTTARAYIDGVEKPVTTTGVSSYPTYGIFIGRGYAPANGTIDAVHVFSRVFTADEIGRLYAAEKGRFEMASSDILAP